MSNSPGHLAVGLLDILRGKPETVDGQAAILTCAVAVLTLTQAHSKPRS